MNNAYFMSLIVYVMQITHQLFVFILVLRVSGTIEFELSASMWFAFVEFTLICGIVVRVALRDVGVATPLGFGKVVRVWMFER
jgi:hypothetical protein